MSLFTILNYDDKVQVGDKVRIGATNSFSAKGSDAITTMTVKPTADDAAVDIFSADPEERYLDWMYSDFSADIDATNDKVDFEVSGYAGAYVATMSTGNYSLNGLRAELETQLNTASPGGTFTVSLDNKDRLKIEADVQFKLLGFSGDNTRVGALPLLGFAKDSNTTKDLTGETMDKLPRSVTLEIGDGVTTESVTEKMFVFSPFGDRLFSSDADLLPLESKLMRYLPKSRSSYNYAHREAQKNIIEYLDREGYVNIYKQPYDKFDLIRFEEVNEWSKYLALRLIYDDLVNSQGDHWRDKANDALEQETAKRARLRLRLDINRDGDLNIIGDEGLNLKSSEVLRR